MGDRGQARGEAFSRKFREIIDQSNRPELRDQLGTLNLRDERDNNIVKMGDIHRPKAESLNDLTDQRLKPSPEPLEERNRESIRARGGIRIGRLNNLPYLLIRERQH